MQALLREYRASTSCAYKPRPPSGEPPAREPITHRETGEIQLTLKMLVVVQQAPDRRPHVTAAKRYGVIDLGFRPRINLGQLAGTWLRGDFGNRPCICAGQGYFLGVLRRA